jgi:hypothetical protein
MQVVPNSKRIRFHRSHHTHHVDETTLFQAELFTWYLCFFLKTQQDLYQNHIWDIKIRCGWSCHYSWTRKYCIVNRQSVIKVAIAALPYCKTQWNCCRCISLYLQLNLKDIVIHSSTNTSIKEGYCGGGTSTQDFNKWIATFGAKYVTRTNNG